MRAKRVMLKCKYCDEWFDSTLYPNTEVLICNACLLCSRGNLDKRFTIKNLEGGDE